ncbi:hypothetical protein THII_1506 [Thioploca ingrica]|uniref:Fibronectin type-III domain-containing protein n=1 Tax=Thioploca ingrica TaxID=40754 RepID=A0A090ADB2_9GAMM|nr:hypothetical protein THII_1506 [Thioploca ingrica]
MAMVVFKRDLSTGQLSLQQVLKKEQLGMGESSINVSPVVVSADNRFVYMTAYNYSGESVVAIFARDLSTGQLTLQQLLKNGQNGVEWLEKPYLITVSADDQFVYVLGDQQLSVLERDPSTGELRFQQAQEDWYCDYYGDSVPTSVAVSADNLWVYVVCERNDSVEERGMSVFIRDPSTGQLILQDRWYYYNDWFWGTPSSVAVSHDSRFVYITSPKTDTIMVSAQINNSPENYIYYSYQDNPIIFNENTSFTFVTTWWESIRDLDAGIFPLQVTLTVTNGTLTLNGREGLSFTEGDGTADNRLVFIGTLTAINNALKGMTFTPTLNFYGEATLNIVTDDLGHTGYGGAQQDTDTLIIKVLDVNEPPVIETIATQYGIPNKLLSFKVIAIDPNVPKQNLTYKLINKDLPPGASIDSETGQFKWTPLPTQIGIFKLTVAVTDNGVNPDNLEASQTFEVIISDTPILKPIGAQTVLVDNTLTFTAQADFLETPALTFSLLNAPTGAQIDKKTGKFTWTPTQTGEFPVTVMVTEPFGQRTAEETVIITVTQVLTSLELTLNSVAIFQNGHLTAKGKLTSYPQQPAGLKELPIQLQITAPDGSITTQEVTTIASGEYHFTQLPAFTQTGQYQLQAQFANDDRLAASQSEPQTVLVSALAGYALLVQGRDAKGNGQEAYGKSLNRVYQKLINRGFIDDNIDYLGFDQNQIGVLVDDTPDKAKIQNTLKTLQTRLNADPAPLYIVMVDHGDLEGNFHLDNGNHEEIAPTELNNWLAALEQGLNDPAKAQPRVIIIGSCYSGNFISALSKPGRILVTSTAPGEESYKGPKEPDEVRSGEYFIEALFAQLGQGYSLKTAFELATQSTELFTRTDDTDFFNEQFQDNAVQHPLLDDNSDNQGSNVLGVDGQAAKTIYLGLGPQYDPTAPDSPAVILSVTPTVHLEANTTSAPLWARVNQPSRVKGEQVFVDIRPPSLQLTNNGIEQRETLAMEGLERIELGLASDSEFSGHFDGFTQMGRYELFYFVVDSETGDRSPLQRSLVYKDRAGNQPPTPVQLRAPQNGDETHTTVIFAWQPSPDPDNDPVTYTFLLATEPSMQQIIYRQEELRMTMTYLNSESVIADPLNQGQPGLRDGTKYAWQVQAIDKYGAVAESPVFTFQTNDTNLPPGLGSLYVYNAVDFVSLDNAMLDFWVVDEWGNLVLDANGLPIPVQQPPEVFQDQGFYNLTLPYGRRRATLHATGYQDQPVLIDTTDGLAHLRVAMTPAGGISIQPGQLQLTAEQTRVDETQGQIALVVKRVGGDDGVVSVAYQLLPDSSASLGSDYSVQEGQLTWADQDSLPKKISVTLHDDDQKEGDETFTVRLNNPSGGATLGTPNTINITLLDDEAQQPLQSGTLQFQVPTYSATEGTVLPSILVSRVKGSNGTVAVQYSITPQSTAIASDYTGGTGILEWADGDTEPKPLQLTLIDDSEAEAVEIIQLTLFNPTGGVQLGEPIQTTLTIADNEITTQPGENMVIVPPQPGDTTIPKTDPPKTDTLPVIEPSESQAGVLQFLAPTYSLNEGLGSVRTFTVTRSGGSQGAVSVEYATIGGTAEMGLDYVGGTGLLTWADGDDMPKAIELTVLDDQEAEKAETIQLQLANPTGRATLTLYRQATLIIADNDTTAAQSPHEELASIEFTSPLFWAQEEDNLAELTVLRTGSSQGEVSVQYITTTNSSAILGDDYLNGSGTLVWADQETQPQTITLNLIDDQLPDEEIIHLLLVNPTGQARLGKQSEAAVIIKDNDKPVIAPSQPAVLQFTQTFATVPENQGYILISIIRTGNHQEPITVDYETISETATAHEDYLPSQGRLSWDESEKEMISLIIPILKDNQVEPDETFVIRLSNPSAAAQLGPLSQITIQIQDQESYSDTQPSPLLPNLGRGMALVNSLSTQWKTSLNCQAFPCPLKAAFRGGSSLNGLSYHPQLTLHPYQYVNIRGEMDVAAEHVGQPAELLIVAAWKPINSTEPENYFMQDNQGQILPWDLNLAHLVAAQKAVTLMPTQVIDLYTGFLGSGQIRLFFGYQLPDGVIVFNGEQSVELVVKTLAED